MAFSFSADCVHLLAHFLLAKLYEVSAIPMPLLQSKTERPRKLWPLLGSHSRVEPRTSKVWRPCKAPGPGRPPGPTLARILSRPEARQGTSRAGTTAYGTRRVAASWQWPLGTALPRLLPASRTENTAAWHETTAECTRGGAHTEAGFLKTLGRQGHKSPVPTRLHNHTSQKPTRLRAISEHRENRLGFLRNYPSRSDPAAWLLTTCV